MDDQRQLVLDKIAEVFPQLDVEALMRRFEALDNPQKYRIALAILKLSQEDGKDSPDDFIEAARRDYRDVLMWAEFPNEMKLDSWKEPASRVKEVRKKDREQYLEWLNKGKG